MPPENMVLLRYLLGFKKLSFDVIAREVGVSVDTVRLWKLKMEIAARKRSAG